MDPTAWLDQRVFHHQDFEDLAKLAELKKEKNASVSVGLPTVNCERTLPNILDIIQESLQEEHGLVDELIIIDGHSKDKTAAIAHDRGIAVYAEDEILPEAGEGCGKGEALWKSLHVLEGDIVVWVDADIENFHPRFVYGLIGPLLANDEIGYVKGFYQRPIRVKGRLEGSGGGRVTEILSRPLLNLFYPDLALFIQPLSGEYAGRRQILEKVPFYTGYAVETALLIEILNRFGLESMAQVDLARRIHHNQSTQALGKMSFAILQAFFELLEQEKKIKLGYEPNSVFRKVKRRDSTYSLHETQITVSKRPPIEEIAEYQEVQKRRAYERAAARG